MLTKLLAAPAVAAALSLAATPAAAVDLPIANPAPVGAATHHDPHVSAGYGWGWGRGHRHHHRRHRGSTAGDILTGVLVIGAIAAVANAAKRSNERRSYPDRYPEPDRRYDYRPDGPQGLEGAADMCLREVERDARAREVTRVERNAGGWLVTGAMADGAGFTCSIGPDGRIESVDVGGRAQAVEEIDRQYDDERYRSARAEMDAGVDFEAGAEAGPQPAYPGGPLPGEEAEGETPQVTPEL